MLNDATETIAMGSNEHSLAFLNLWNNFLIPEGQSPSNGIFQALTGRQLIFSEVSIAAILGKNIKWPLSDTIQLLSKDQQSTS